MTLFVNDLLERAHRLEKLINSPLIPITNNTFMNTRNSDLHNDTAIWDIINELSDICYEASESEILDLIEKRVEGMPVREQIYVEEMVMDTFKELEANAEDNYKSQEADYISDRGLAYGY